jgi:hypothetical protein
MIDMPEHPSRELKEIRSVGVLSEILDGKSEDSIYRRAIDIAIRAARLEGLDESDVEVVAAGARRHVAEILAECRALGLVTRG